MAASDDGGGKYRSYLTPAELQATQWNNGVPNYDAVNQLFEQGRTKVWPAGSLEEYVQNLVKTWEMELVHKANPDQFKTFDPKNFVIGINGNFSSGNGGGSYNLFLQTSLPPHLRFYNPDEETYDSSQTAFNQVFRRGFAFEVLQVYSGPPVIAFKYRHWGYMEGSFKEYPPSGELIEFFGIAIFELNEDSKVVKVEFFHDRGELLAGLMKGKPSVESSGVASSTSGCPFMA